MIHLNLFQASFKFPAFSVIMFLAFQTNIFANPCKTQKCFKEKAQLIELGYEPTIAERIAAYRPDISHFILNPEITVQLQGITNAEIDQMNSHDLRWFKSQSQNRGPITVYRGLTLSQDGHYDPTYQYKSNDVPIYDPRVFTSDNISTATNYAIRVGKKGLLFRFQIPQFLLYEIKEGPYGLVFFRDLVPNDLLFVTGVAPISPPENLEDDQRREFLEKTVSHLDFKRPEEIAQINQIPLITEERISPYGIFVPTRHWSNALCGIARKPSFKLLRSEFMQKSDFDLLSSIIAPIQKDLDGNDISYEKSRIDQAQKIISQLPISLPDSGTVEEFTVGITINEVHRCIKARKIWLDHFLAQSLRKKDEDRFLSTYKSIHGICPEDTAESKLIRRLIQGL